MKLNDLDGADIDEVFKTLEVLKEDKKEVIKQEREKAKKRHDDYKFSLRGC